MTTTGQHPSIMDTCSHDRKARSYRQRVRREFTPKPLEDNNDSSVDRHGYVFEFLSNL